MTSSSIQTVSAVTALLLSLGPARAATPTDNIIACRLAVGDAERLNCFDREVAKLVPPTFAGRLSIVTDRFAVDRPTRLRFQSDGAIFVLYLKSDAGEVVQNLHIGGGGEDTYLIEQPGTYFLQVNGSESWRIWVEPQAAPAAVN